MELFIGAVILLFGGGFFARGVARARESAWAGPRSSGMRQRASRGPGRGSGGGMRPVRHEIRLLRESARLDDWRAQRDHDRKNGSGAPAGKAAAPPKPATAPAPAAAAPLTGKVIPPLRRARAAAAARFTRPSAPVTGSGSGPSQGAPAAAPGPPPPSPPAASAPPATASPNGRTAAMPTADPGIVEKFTSALSELYQRAISGAMSAKHRSVKALGEAAARSASTAQSLARQMADGPHYGTEITEHVARAATHFAAAESELAEADAAMESLANMTVRQLETSPRQAPHHTELEERGH